MKNKINLPGFTADIAFTTMNNYRRFTLGNGETGLPYIIPSFKDYRLRRNIWDWPLSNVQNKPKGCPHSSSCCCTDINAYDCIIAPIEGCPSSGHTVPIVTI